MENIVLGLCLAAAFALCFFAVDRFGFRMDKACRVQETEQKQSSAWQEEPKPQTSAGQRASVMFIAADSRLLGRLSRETEREKINFM